MVELEDIEYLNFFNIKHAHVPLAGQGFVGVQGDNGSGKTAMFIEGPFFGLYGKSVRTNKKVGTKLRRRGAKGWAVRLKLNDGKNQYEITRSTGIKEIPSGLTLKMNGEDVSRGTMDDTQDAINDTIIGMSPDSARNAVFYTAETMSFPTLGDTKKKEVLDDLLRLDGLEKALKDTKKEITRISGELSKAETRLQTLEEGLKQAETDLGMEKSSLSAWEDTQAGKIEQAEARFEEAAKAATGFDDPMTNLRAEIQRASEEIEKADKILPPLRESKVEIEKELTSLLEKFRTEKAVAEAELKSARNRLAEHTRLLNAEGGECPTCGAELSKDEKAVERHTAAVEAEKDKIKQQEELVAGMKEPEATELRAKLSDAQGEVDAANDFREKWKDAKERFEKQLSDLKTRKVQAESAADLAEQALENEKAATNPHRASVDRLEKNIVDAREKIEALKLETSSLEDLLSEERTLEVLYGPKGCRLDLLNVAIPHLNLKAEEFRRILNTEIRVKFRIKEEGESFAGNLYTEVENPDGASEYEWDSRGERRRADIIMLMSLLSLTSARGSRSINQAFFDEAFESLDPKGEASMLNLLKHIAAGRSSVFSIAHLSHDISGRVDKLWTVEDGVLTM